MFEEGRIIRIIFANKITLSILLLLSTFLFISCSNFNKTEKSEIPDTNELIIDEMVINDDDEGHNHDQETQNTEDIDIHEMTDEEIMEKFPETKIFTNNVGRRSIVINSAIDVSTDIEKEIIETLTEFNAVDTDDGAMLTLPENILFDFDSAELRSEADEPIQQLVQVIESTEGDVTIIGHTDSKGTDEYNQDLSERRAEAILQALVDEEVKKGRLNAEGRGSTEPVAKNTHSDGSDNPEGRQKNRRVEVTINGFNQ